MNYNKQNELDNLQQQQERWNELIVPKESGKSMETLTGAGMINLNDNEGEIIFDEFVMSDEPLIQFEEIIVERDMSLKDNNVEDKNILYKFGKYENVKPEQCDTVFREVLAYENIEMLVDNILDYDLEKDFKMTRLMISFTAYADSYDYDDMLKDFRKYSQVDSKELAGNTIFDIMAIKFGVNEYCKIYSGLKEKSQSSVSKGLFSVAKGLIDEVTKGGFSAIVDDFTKDFMERNYNNSRKKMINDYKEIIKKYDFRPLQIGEIVKDKINELILIDTVKDEFETTEEYNKRIKNSYNKRFSEVFCKYQEMIYKTVKQKIVDYNKQKTLIMLYSSYFFNINKEKLSLGLYDADNGCFKLTDGWNQYSLPVPRTVAKNFKENFSNIKPSCYVINSIKGDKIILKWLISYIFKNQKYITQALNKEVYIK